MSKRDDELVHQQMKEVTDRTVAYIKMLESKVRDLTKGREALVTAVKSLLEWMPICSVGSSGYSRRVAVEKALENL